MVILSAITLVASIVALFALNDCKEEDMRARCEREGGRLIRIEKADPTDRAWFCQPKDDRPRGAK